MPRTGGSTRSRALTSTTRSRPGYQGNARRIRKCGEKSSTLSPRCSRTGGEVPGGGGKRCGEGDASRWMTQPLSISEMIWRLVLSGHVFLIVSLFVFCCLFLTMSRQSQTSKLNNVILTIAHSFSVSASSFILLFIAARADRLAPW